MERDLKEKERRLEAFENMLSFIQKNYDETVMKMDGLKGEGKAKTATYGQLMGNKLTYLSMLDLYKLYDLI